MKWGRPGYHSRMQPLPGTRRIELDPPPYIPYSQESPFSDTPTAPPVAGLAPSPLAAPAYAPPLPHTSVQAPAAAPSALPPLTLRITGLTKRYGDTTVFENVNLRVEPGEFVAIVGESGVGKSTLLNCMAGLDGWDAGSVLLAGADLGAMDDTARALLRRSAVGFVFQAFHVLPHLDVAQNIALPLMLLSTAADKKIKTPWAQDPRVEEMLAAVGLEGLGNRLPQQLSGGQLQRVAIARALIHRPQLLLADEPTGNLDPATAAKVMDVLSTQAREHGTSVVLVTHSQAAAARADRICNLRADGMDSFRNTRDERREQSERDDRRDRSPARSQPRRPR